MNLQVLFAYILCCLFVVHAESDSDENECIEDRRQGIGMSKDGNDHYVIDTIKFDSNDQLECEKACCARGDECNVAVFERRKSNKFICTLLFCDPFDNCEWEPRMSSSVSRMRLINSTKAENKYDEIMEEEEEREEAIETGEEPPTEATTFNMSALYNEEQEELNEAFQKAFGSDDDWNINTENVGEDRQDVSVSTAAWNDEDVWNDDNNGWNDDENGWNDDDWIDQAAENNDNNDNFDDNVDNHEVDNNVDQWNEDWDDNNSSEEGNKSSEEDESHESTGSSEEGSTETNRHDNHKPDHPNNGVWGPSNIQDIDYDENQAAPFIVLGVIVSIVFILMVLIFVARRLSVNTERLKYRPLNESFPSSNPYHDSKNYGQYHDIE